MPSVPRKLGDKKRGIFFKEESTTARDAKQESEETDEEMDKQTDEQTNG